MNNLTTGTLSIAGTRKKPVNGSVVGTTLERFWTIDMDNASANNLSNATVVFTYAQGDLASNADESTVRVYHYNESNSNYDLLPNAVVSTSTNTVSAFTTQFSTFALFAATSSSSASSSSSGGGGGGGGNVFGGETKNLGNLKTGGEDVIMSAEGEVLFTLAVDNSEHRMFVTTVDEAEQKVTGEVFSEPQAFTLGVGETMLFDLSGNGMDDFALRLDRIYRNRAYFTMQDLVEEG